MNTSKKAIALAIGGAFVASVAATHVSAATNPFALKTLTAGYMVADAKEMKDGKCGTGKCGADKAKMNAEKAPEASCSAEKVKDGSCHADKMMDKTKEASCSAAKDKEGSCHADKK